MKPDELDLLGKESSNLSVSVEQLSRDDVEDFKDKHLLPYFSDIFSDLHLRCSHPVVTRSKEDASQQEVNLDKVTFITYCNLPGIMGDRVAYLCSLRH